MVRKEFLQIQRDPLTMCIVIFAPLIMLLLYGYAVTFDIRNIPMYVCDQDRTQESRDFLAHFPRDYFNVYGITEEPSDFEVQLDSGQARLALWIPTGFKKNIHANQTVPIYVGIDGADSNTANVAIGYLEGVVQNFSSKILITRLQNSSTVSFSTPIQTETRVWYNPELKSSHFILPGLVALLLMMITTLLPAMAITSEKENNTIEQLAASPIKPLELMVGKMLPYAAISSFGVLLVVTLGRSIFRVPLRGDVLTLGLFSGLFLLTALTLGLLISTMAKSQQAAMMTSVMATTLPTFLLSGFVFPIANMPVVLRGLTYLIPARYFITALRSIFLKGVGLKILWPQAAALTAYTICLLLLASLRFKKQV